MISAGTSPTAERQSALGTASLSGCRRKGYFITLEGSDGCGKTTLALLLERKLRALGYSVLRTREPGGCPLSEKIRELLLSTASAGMKGMTEALLYAAARAQHVREVIAPALEAGKIVLCDRFVDSSIAYQGAGRKLGMDAIEALNAPAVGGCMPDLTIYLKVDTRLATRRRLEASPADRIEIEMLDDGFRRRVRDAYHFLAQRDAGRYTVIDAAKDPEPLSEEALACVMERLCKRETG